MRTIGNVHYAKIILGFLIGSINAKFAIALSARLVIQAKGKTNAMLVLEDYFRKRF
jgi:hypothetical protein